MRNKMLISLLLVASVLLAACGESNDNKSKTSEVSDLPSDVQIALDEAINSVGGTIPLEESAIGPVTSNNNWTPVERDFNGSVMVLVPPGCFPMGSDIYPAPETSRPVHEICIDSPFWIDKYEVTNGQFGSLSQESSCPDFSSEPNQPRICVTWGEAKEYCDARGARLPTEAEWEYAARGPDGFEYPWGNRFDENNVVWGLMSGDIDSTAEVGSIPAGASWVGALDMSGNAAEWVSSYYREYPYDETHETIAQEATTENSPMTRGGSFEWATNPYGVTTHVRNYVYSIRADEQDPDDFFTLASGIRCVRDSEGSDLPGDIAMALDEANNPDGEDISYEILSLRHIPSVGVEEGPNGENIFTDMLAGGVELWCVELSQQVSANVYSYLAMGAVSEETEIVTTSNFQVIKTRGAWYVLGEDRFTSYCANE